MNKEIAECVGLWLAEGDRKTNAEITFTNNCLSLIKHFHKTLTSLFEMKNYNPRIYIYSPNNKYPKIKLDGIKIKKYVDKRATKLYCIWRVASVELVKVWKSLVVENSSKEENYSSILRGFLQEKAI